MMAALFRVHSLHEATESPMPLREQLPAVLRGEVAADLSPEGRAELDSLAHQAQAERLLPFARDECAARLRQPGASPAVEYLLAAACALHGEIERAHQTLLALGEKLVAAGSFEPLAAVAERALALEETHAAARLLVRAHEGLKKDPERIEALQRAWALMPDDLEVGLLLAVRLGEAGHGEQRRELLAELMPRFAAEARYAGLEEAALEFVEHGTLGGLTRLLQTLPVVADQGAFTECVQLLEISFPPVAEAGRAGECHAALRAVARLVIEQQGPAAGERFRAAVVESLRQSVARQLPDPARVFELSGLDDPMKPLLPALERFDRIAALPPGRAVHHETFGPGRVVASDGESVRVDFAHARGHRMPYDAARRSLTPLAEDDLRLLRLTGAQELERLRAEDPGEILVRALRAVGGAADAQRLKVFLVGSHLVSASEWAGFWRRARAAAEKDPRVDHARAFEQHYRLAPEGPPGTDESPLPALAPRKSVRSNLGTLRKFLAQHPHADAALAQRFGRFVANAVTDPNGDRTDRARAGILFARWFPERREEWAGVLRSLWEQGLAITDLPAEDEQLAVLEASHAAGVESDAILSALDSRFSAVREAASRIRARLDDAGRADLRRTLLRHAPRHPSAALRRIEEELAQSQAPADAWEVLHAALALIEDRARPSVAEKLLRALEPGGAFDRLLEGAECSEEVALRVRVLLRQWRSSDRFLFPALEQVERAGLVEEAEAVREERQRRSERMFATVGQQAEDRELSVMTRATWARLHRELELLERELRTTIPATIRKARELGDLRENAEYHSAKLKQATVSKRATSLARRLARARFVDDAEYKPGVAGLGTRVRLEGDGRTRSYWILGEGEQHHGPEVVSFQSAVGRALMNRSVGDEVELGEEGERRRFRVAAVERQLPAPEGANAVEPQA